MVDITHFVHLGGRQQGSIIGDFNKAPPWKRRRKDLLISEDDLLVSFSAEECYGKYVDLHDIYQEYNNLKFNFDNTTVNTTEANQGANPLALVAARHQSIDYTTFLQVSICPLPVARLRGSSREGCKRWVHWEG